MNSKENPTQSIIAGRVEYLQKMGRTKDCAILRDALSSIENNTASLLKAQKSLRAVSFKDDNINAALETLSNALEQLRCDT